MLQQQDIQKIYDILLQRNYQKELFGDTELKEKGKDYFRCCPFHSEKTASFSISKDKPIFKCFGCGKSGDWIEYLKQTRNMTFHESIKFLASAAGIEISQENTIQNQKQYEKQRKLTSILNDAQKYFRKNIKEIKDNIVIKHLKERGFPDNCCDIEEIGYHVSSKSFREYMQSCGYNKEDIKEAGLYKTWCFEDYQLSIAYKDHLGNIKGFAFRSLSGKDPKYQNSNGLKLDYLFNQERTRTYDNLIVVESFLDVLLCESLGIKNVVALGGKEIKDAAKDNLMRKSKARYLVLCLDQDENKSGQKATFKLINYLKDNFVVFCANHDHLGDPGEIIKNKGVKNFKKIIQNCISANQYKLNYIINQNSDSALGNRKSLDDVAREINNENNPAEKDKFIKQAAKRFKISQRALKDICENNRDTEKIKEGNSLTEKKEPEFFYKNYCTYVRHYRKAGNYFVPEEEIIAYFTCEILREIINDESEISYEIKVVKQEGSKKPEEKTLEVLGEDLQDFSKFNALMGRNGFTPNSLLSRFLLNYVQHLKNVHDKRKLFRKTHYIGRVEKDIFILNENMITPEGIQLTDKYILPDNNMNFDRDLVLNTDFESLLDDLFYIYEGELWKIIGFAVASVFQAEIVETFDMFPLLFLSGTSEAGKGTLASFIKSMFGATQELGNMQLSSGISSTAKAIIRKFSKYKGMPLFINEYEPNKQTNALLRQIFDREARSTAKFSNDMQTIDHKINSSLIFMGTRNVSGVYSDEVINRYIEVDMNKPNRDSKKISLMKKSDYLAKLAKFIYLTFTRIRPEKLIEKIEQVVDEFDYGVNDRITKTHSICLGAYNYFLEVINCEKYATDTERVQIEINEHQKKTRESNAATGFLELLQYCLDKDKDKEIGSTNRLLPCGYAAYYDHSQEDTTSQYLYLPEKYKLQDKNKTRIFFRLDKCAIALRSLARQMNTEIADSKTLGKHLRQLGADSGKSRNLSKFVDIKAHGPFHVWYIDIDNGIGGDEELED